MPNVYVVSLGNRVSQKGNGVDTVVCIAADAPAALVLAEAATAGDVAGIWAGATVTLLGDTVAFVAGTVFSGAEHSFTAPVPV